MQRRPLGLPLASKTACSEHSMAFSGLLNNIASDSFHLVVDISLDLYIILELYPELKSNNPHLCCCSLFFFKKINSRLSQCLSKVRELPCQCPYLAA